MKAGGNQWKWELMKVSGYKWKWRWKHPKMSESDSDSEWIIVKREYENIYTNDVSLNNGL